MWIFKSISTTIRFSTLCFTKLSQDHKMTSFFIFFFSISTFYSIWERVREREREYYNIFSINFLSTTFQLCPLKFFFLVCDTIIFFWGRGIQFQKIFFIKRQARSPIPLYFFNNKCKMIHIFYRDHPKNLLIATFF